MCDKVVLLQTIKVDGGICTNEGRSEANIVFMTYDWGIFNLRWILLTSRVAWTRGAPRIYLHHWQRNRKRQQQQTERTSPQRKVVRLEQP